MPINNTNQPDIYTVSRLNNEIRFLLEDQFPMIWVEGEISNFACPHSGHWYFSLKDAQAQVRCALFKGNQNAINFNPKNGLHVLIKARASLYPNRGEYQLIAEHIEERGQGKLRLAYELLKNKLELAGLFKLEAKKNLPLFPQRIGVITSATGAALHDILTVLKRRFTCVPVIIYPTLVQGQAASPNIIKAIQLANQRRECDVLILARGGGSLEDLWAFNEEALAYAIYQSRIPLISGIGHEVDFTIADFVADKRAATPSAAAEMTTPDQFELLKILLKQKQQLFRKIINDITNYKQSLAWIKKNLALQHPKRKLAEKIQNLDAYEVKLTQLQIHLIQNLRNKLTHLTIKLSNLTPLHFIQNSQGQMQSAQQKLIALMVAKLMTEKAALSNFAAKLNVLSPLATLDRGYAIATNQKQQIIYSKAQVKPEDEITVRVKQALIYCRVDKINEI